MSNLTIFQGFDYLKKNYKEYMTKSDAKYALIIELPMQFNLCGPLKFANSAHDEDTWPIFFSWAPIA